MNDIYTLSKYIPQGVTAGEKAPKDINEILNKDFNAQTIMLYRNNMKFVRNIQSMYYSHKYFLKLNNSDAILIVQWPMYLVKPISNDKILNINCRYKIAFIHDIDSLRLYPERSDKHKHEVEQLNNFDVVIAHNNSMKEWLIKNGLACPIVTLEMFDYLSQPNENIVQDTNDYKSVVFAGNLDKSVFLRKYKGNTHINLYGKLTTYAIKADNMTYHGSFSPEQLCEYLVNGFGLVWDGTNCDKCDGREGYYTRYNNPHKLSLYISCGIPVIVWRQAAIAEIVAKYNIGIAVDSLDEMTGIIENMSESQYCELKRNVDKVRKMVINGQFTKKAINSALGILDENWERK